MLNKRPEYIPEKKEKKKEKKQEQAKKTPLTKEELLKEFKKLVDKAHGIGLEPGWQKWLLSEVDKENKKLSDHREAQIEVLDDEAKIAEEELLKITRKDIKKVVQSYVEAVDEKKKIKSKSIEGSSNK